MADTSERGRTRLGWRDAFSEARATLSTNRLRTVASGLAVGVAAAAIIALLVVTATITNQVSADFDELRATTVYVTPTEQIPPDQVVFPLDTAARLARIPGVNAGGRVVSDPMQKVPVATSNVSGDAAVEAELIGVDFSVLAATEATGIERAPQAAFDAGATVALVGDRLAERLGVGADAVGHGATITIDGLSFELVGIIASPQRLTDTANSVVVPMAAAQRLIEFKPTDYRVVIETASGAASTVGDAVTPTLAPERSDPYIVEVPPEAKEFRRKVEGNISAMVAAMAGLAALIGAISIASTTYSGVVERTHELGLRRAIGAKPRHIAAQILIESMLTTLAAAVVGTVFGLTGALIYARVNDWVSIVEPWHLAAIPIAAAVLGVIAGMLPARRASTIDPSIALRQ